MRTRTQAPALSQIACSRTSCPVSRKQGAERRLEVRGAERAGKSRVVEIGRERVGPPEEDQG